MYCIRTQSLSKQSISLLKMQSIFFQFTIKTCRPTQLIIQHLNKQQCIAPYVLYGLERADKNQLEKTKQKNKQCLFCIIDVSQIAPKKQMQKGCVHYRNFWCYHLTLSIGSTADGRCSYRRCLYQTQAKLWQQHKNNLWKWRWSTPGPDE